MVAYRHHNHTATVNRIGMYSPVLIAAWDYVGAYYHMVASFKPVGLKAIGEFRSTFLGGIVGHGYSPRSFPSISAASYRLELSLVPRGI